MYVDLIVTIILAACKGDTKTYMIQEYQQDCYIYMANCVVDKNIDFCLDKIGKGKTNENKTRGTKEGS